MPLTHPIVDPRQHSELVKHGELAGLQLKHVPDWQVRVLQQSPLLAQPSPRKLQMSQVPLTQIPVLPLHCASWFRGVPAGQAPVLPVHRASFRQSDAAWQTVVLDEKTLPGQSSELPLQVSSGSHGPVEDRQTDPTCLGVSPQTPSSQVAACWQVPATGWGQSVGA